MIVEGIVMFCAASIVKTKHYRLTRVRNASIVVSGIWMDDAIVSNAIDPHQWSGLVAKL
ncbi:hypothetical protein LZ190_26655 [Rhodovulum sulfidophilum]|nr:hypothetical protein [Rhodovulum sulfidophilum]